MQENPTVWLFDLDNTLHDADAGIFHLINRAMTRYMARRLKLSESAASDLRQDYWRPLRRNARRTANPPSRNRHCGIFTRKPSDRCNPDQAARHGGYGKHPMPSERAQRRFSTVRRFTSVPFLSASVWKTVSTHCSARMISDCCTNPIRKRISMSAACWTYRPNAALWWTTARTTSIRQKHWA